jgi:hypothetical protein
MRKTLIALASMGTIALAPAAALAAGGVITGLAGGAVTGAIIGGPPGAAIGGVIGAFLGAAVDPPPQEVVSYVATQAPPPVYLEGSLAVGAILPPTVVLYPVPPDVYVPVDGHAYAYAFINGQRVIVDSGNRVIVAVAG